jgi:general secretion pathway protein L
MAFFRKRLRPGLWQIWVASVCECVGAFWCKVLRGRREQMVIIPHGSRALARLQTRQGLVEVPPLDLDGPVPNWPGVGGGGVTAEVVLRLPEVLYLHRVAALPLAAEESLPQVIELEIDRLTPFARGEALFDHRVVTKDKVAGQLRVAVVAAAREVVEPWLIRLAAAGCRPAVIDTEQGWQGQNLLPLHERLSRRVGPRWVGGLVFLVVILGLGTLLTPLVVKRQQVLALAPLVSAARLAADKALSLREEVQKQKESARRVLDLRLASMPMTSVLKGLTHLLPDTTWLQELDVQGSDVQLHGEATQASALIGILDDSRMFTDVAFPAPVVQMPGTGTERFHISAKVRAGNGR